MKSEAEWQLVLVLWGTKYGVTEVSQLLETIEHHSSRPFRTVLITDRPRKDLPDRILQREFPEFYCKEEMRTSGCLAKLAMFEGGVVPQDLPAIYVDIDTVILGDLSKLLSIFTAENSVFMLKGAMIPIGAIGRCLWRMTKKRRYARGNSSVVIYHPKATAYIADQFKELFVVNSRDNFRPLWADDRFISWVAQEQLRVIPRNLAVKFPAEFMLPWAWLIYLRAALPWTKVRWKNLLVVTLPGVEVNGQDLLALPDGSSIKDRRGRRLIWSRKAIGPMKKKLTDYYSALDAREEESKQ